MSPYGACQIVLKMGSANAMDKQSVILCQLRNTALRMIIAPTVLTSNAPPRKMSIPNAMKTAIVAAAMAADSCAVQRFHRNNPTPAIT